MKTSIKKRMYVHNSKGFARLQSFFEKITDGRRRLSKDGFPLIMKPAAAPFRKKSHAKGGVAKKTAMEKIRHPLVGATKKRRTLGKKCIPKTPWKKYPPRQRRRCKKHRHGEKTPPKGRRDKKSPSIMRKSDKSPRQELRTKKYPPPKGRRVSVVRQNA